MMIWERELERKKLWRLFNRGKNVALFAPRRLGKTWLMKTLEKEADEKGYTAIFIDLEAETTAEGAVRKLCKEISTKQIFTSLWKQMKTRLIDILQGDTSIENYQALLLKTDWDSMLNATLTALDHAEKPILILIDEVSVCLSSLLAVSRKEGSILMRRLREHRENFTNIRWMLTGSIGLDHVADQYGLGGALNELEPFPLEPLTQDQAKAYVNHLCDKRELPRLEDSAHNRLQSRLGWLAPHYLSRFLDRIEDQAENQPVDTLQIDAACDTLLKYPYNRLFSDWPDHINRNYPDKQKIAALKLLKVLCRHSDGETIEALKNTDTLTNQEEGPLQAALISLINDGFLYKGPESQRYCFVFGLLREYWKRCQSV